MSISVFLAFCMFLLWICKLGSLAELVRLISPSFGADSSSIVGVNESATNPTTQIRTPAIPKEYTGILTHNRTTKSGYGINGPIRFHYFCLQIYKSYILKRNGLFFFFFFFVCPEIISELVRATNLKFGRRV